LRKEKACPPSTEQKTTVIGAVSCTLGQIKSLGRSEDDTAPVNGMLAVSIYIKNW
jgi:hypothetical protein